MNIFENIQGINELFGRGAWMVFYLSVALAAFAVFYRQIIGLIKHFPKESNFFALGFVIFVSGGVLVELVYFSYFETFTNFQNGLQVAVEEFLEMSGISVILYSILGLLKKNYNNI